MDVTLYARPGCHLCEEAELMLRYLRRRVRYSLHVVDIESDDDLLRRYMLEIPVVAVDDRVVAKAPLDHTSLEKVLREEFKRGR